MRDDTIDMDAVCATLDEAVKESLARKADVVETPPAPPKVVDLKGNAVSLETTTSAKIMEFIEALRSTAAGEKHLAVGFFLVDAEGRCWTNFRMEPGSGLDSIGAVTLLKDRVLRAYEAEQQS